MTDQESDRLNQHMAEAKAMARAVGMWQKETSNPGTMPRLNVLLEWLMTAMETPRIREVEKRLDWEQKNAEKLAIRLQQLEEILKAVPHLHPKPPPSIAADFPECVYAKECPACQYNLWRNNP